MRAAEPSEKSSQEPRRRWNDEEALTLVELLVVTLIIGILAGIGIPAYASIRDRAEEAAARASLRNVVLGLEMNFLDPDSGARIEIGGVSVVDASIGSQSSDEVALDVVGDNLRTFLLTARANRNCVDAAHRRHGSTTWSSRFGDSQSSCRPVQPGSPN